MNKTSNLVAKSNALIEASYRLSVYEQRILLACISQIGRDDQITSDVRYSVSAQDIARLSNIPVESAYQKLDEASLRLKRRELRITEEPNGKGRKPKVMVTGWIQTVVYVPEEGRVELRFNEDMIPYINMLSTEFTRYALGDVAAMTSVHGIRLYELLMQWKKRGWREVSIDWLREALCLEGQYPVYADLKRWVIEAAVTQINEHSPITVKWKPVKTGRKVTHVMFTFSKKAPTRSRKAGKKPSKPNGQGGGSNASSGLPEPLVRQYMQEGDTYEQGEARARARLAALRGE